MPQSDSELWKRILDGDENAWAVLVNRYQALVYAIPTRAGLRTADCADCFQQTWVALYENRRKINDPTRLSSWLVTTAKRATQYRLRREKPAENIDDVERIDPDPLPDEELIRLEFQAQLEIALREMDPRCRKVLTAFFYSSEKKSYEKIASELGISSNSLGPVRKRCLERLRRILEEMGFDEVRKKDNESL